MAKPEHMARGFQAHCIDFSGEVVPDSLPLLGYVLGSLTPSDVVNVTIHLLFQEEPTHHCFLTTSPGSRVERSWIYSIVLGRLQRVLGDQMDGVVVV